jgi:hypothetical protein
MYEDAIKTSGNADRLELRELTELIEEALAPAGPPVAVGGPSSDQPEGSDRRVDD